MMMMGMTTSLLLTVLLGSQTVMLPAMVAAGAAVVAQHEYGRTPAAAPEAEDVALLELREVKGLDASGRLLACRRGGEWQPGLSCDPAFVSGRELRVFTGAGGEVARWTTGEATAKAGLDGAEVTVVGKLSAPLPESDPEDALRVPFALMGDARHLIEPPSQEGWTKESLDGVLQLARRVARMNKKMSEGLQPEQHTVFNLTPARHEVVAVAGSTYPSGPLDKAPLPSASILVVHDPAGTDWARWMVLQVISKPQDTRRFERYSVAAVLDIDGDGWRELLVRARSTLGDRFRLFRLKDDVRFEGLGEWAGVVQAASAPGAIR